MSAEMSIGTLSKRCDVKVVTIRYYEKTGLMPPPNRTASGQRRYTSQHVRRLGFIRHARELGFSPTAIRELLDLADHPQSPCKDAHLLAQKHMQDVAKRIENLQRLHTELQVMSACDHQDAQHCRILEAISDFDHQHCHSHHKPETTSCV